MMKSQNNVLRQSFSVNPKAIRGYFLLVCEQCNEPIEEKEFAILRLPQGDILYHKDCVPLLIANKDTDNPVIKLYENEI